jgi:hypothetical protein
LATDKADVNKPIKGELTMSTDDNDSRWMDERDPDMQPGLKCDVEITVESGETLRDCAAEVARALRTTAVLIEEGKLEDGFSPIKTLSGEEIGEVYVDWYGTGDR